LPEANRAEGNVGGALRRSSAEPRAPKIPSDNLPSNQVQKGEAWAGC
jgi:hypothetical protein